MELGLVLQKASDNFDFLFCSNGKVLLQGLESLGPVLPCFLTMSCLK